MTLVEDPTSAQPGAVPGRSAGVRTPGLVPGWRVIELDWVGSTNQEARRRAYDGALPRTVVCAREQLAGRGRDGRVWHSPEGNVYLSALVRPDIRSGRMPELSFVAALAVADAVDRLLPPGRTSLLKWPNDLLVNDAKIAGILIETAGATVIIGIGLNVAHAPDDATRRTTSLQLEGVTVTVPEARAVLLDALSERLAQWQQSGFAATRADWLARAHPLGTRLEVRNPATEGRFAGLDEDGALLLDTDQGRRRIVAGDVIAY